LKRIKKRFEEIICNQKINKPLGLLYSGGLDSTIIAYIMTQCLPFSSLNFVSVGFPESFDMRNASFGAKELRLNHHECFLSIDIIKETIMRLKQLNIIHNPVHLTVAIPIYLGLQMISEKYQTKTIFLGQGADELFCGYKRYSLLYEEKKYEKISSIMAADLKSLIGSQAKMETSLAEHLGVNLVYPYLDPKVIKVANSYPIESHITSIDGMIIRKVVLRSLAKSFGLSESITTQQKKAFQYGSGTVKALRKIIKEHGYANIHDWFFSWFKTEE
jgi:asparagine synthase (glutamine-hydrolysing)